MGAWPPHDKEVWLKVQNAVREKKRKRQRKSRVTTQQLLCQGIVRHPDSDEFLVVKFVSQDSLIFCIHFLRNLKGCGIKPIPDLVLFGI